MASGTRRPGMEHIPRYPPGWITIRILQLIVSLICIGLGAYSATRRAVAGPLLTVWASFCTLIVSIWLISAHSCAPRAFNYWATLVLDIYLYILWLGSFAACAIVAGGILAANSDDYDYSYDYDYDYLDTYDRTAGAITAAAAGLGAFNWLLFFICIVTDAVVIHKHRKQGLRSRPLKAGSAAAIMVQQPQIKPEYHAVPQQGIPLQQQDTAYNPYQQPLNTAAPSYYAQQPQQHTSYYGAQPIAPQHTGASLPPHQPSPAPYVPGQP